jgi:hypothetical protein
MYRWYKKSLVCFVYLADVELLELPENERNIEEILNNWFLQTSDSRWYTRGWTLQELIAPTNVEFYDKTWGFLGNRKELARSLEAITMIPYSLLRSGVGILGFTIAQRMSWASQRATTRKEDMAYSLLGIMCVNMPLLYGEGGERAFKRLQEEILKITTDQSIFAWTTPDTTYFTWHSLLALSPKAFVVGTDIKKKRLWSVYEAEWQITNRGLKTSFPVIRASARFQSTDVFILLQCGTDVEDDDHIVIRLMKVSRDLYARVDAKKHILMPRTKWEDTQASTKTICVALDLSDVAVWYNYSTLRIGCVDFFLKNGQTSRFLHSDKASDRVSLFTEDADTVQHFCYVVTLPGRERYCLSSAVPAFSGQRRFNLLLCTASLV